MLRQVKAGLGRLSIYMHRLNSWLIVPALVLLVFTDICFRTIGFSSITWSHEVAGLMLLTIFFLSLPFCYLRNEYLAVDFIHNKLPKLLQQITQLASYGLVAFFSGLLSWQSYMATIDMMEFEEEAYTIAIPLWPFSASISACAALIGLLALIQICDRSWKATSS